MNKDNYIWGEETNYNNNWYDCYTYQQGEYSQKMPVILPKERKVIVEKKPLLRSIEI